MQHPGHWFVCLWLMAIAISSCQDENTKKLIAAIDKNTETAANVIDLFSLPDDDDSMHIDRRTR